MSMGCDGKVCSLKFSPGGAFVHFMFRPLPLRYEAVYLSIIVSLPCETYIWVCYYTDIWGKCLHGLSITTVKILFQKSISVLDSVTVLF